MEKVILIFNDNETYTIENNKVDISAFSNWYDTSRKFNDSINLSRIYADNDDFSLELRTILDIINEREIISVKWINNEKDILTLTGNIIPSWSLTATPVLNEIINFTIT